MNEKIFSILQIQKKKTRIHTNSNVVSLFGLWTRCTDTLQTYRLVVVAVVKFSCIFQHILIETQIKPDITNSKHLLKLFNSHSFGGYGKKSKHKQTEIAIVSVRAIEYNDNSNGGA